MTLTLPRQRTPVVVLGVLLGVLGVWLWQVSPTPTEMPIPKQAVVAESTSNVVIPTNPGLNRSAMQLLLRQVRAGEMFTVVRYHCKDVSCPDDKPINNNLAFGAQPFIFEEKIRLQGVCEEVKLLRGRFEFGEIEISYTRQNEQLIGGGYPSDESLDLLKKVSVGQSFLFLANSQQGSPLFAKAKFTMCLEPEEVPCVKEWFEQAKGYDKVGQPTAEKWLRSANPWLVWLGITRLSDLKCLNADHLAGVIERRPAAETSLYIVEMVNSAPWFFADRTQFQEALERVFQLPGRQIPAMWTLARSLHLQLHVRHQFHKVSGLLPWLKSYRKQLVAGAADKDIIRAVDALTTVLNRPIYLKGPSSPPDSPSAYDH